MEHYARGYAPRAKTPVLVRSQSKRCRINLISAVTNQGTLRFMLYRETLDANMFIKFLKRLHKDADKKVFLIVDNLRVHHAKKVSAWLAEHTEEIELFYLPSYSPELNPDEYLNCDLKARMDACEPVRTPRPRKASCLDACGPCKNSRSEFVRISNMRKFAMPPDLFGNLLPG